MKSKLFLITGFMLLFTGQTLFAQTTTKSYGNPANKKFGIHSGNLVKTVFNNAGVVGQPADKGPRGSWVYNNNGYIGDISLMVGLEVQMPATTDFNSPIIKNLITKNGGKVFHSVQISDFARPSSKDYLPGGVDGYLTFEPKGGYAKADQQYVATSNNRSSWPPNWPDQGSDWNGFWNGYFGKVARSDQESFYVMDDNMDVEFNRAPFNVTPDSTDKTRGGLGLDVKVRGLQWAQFLAQDCIFWLYEITNTSDLDYNKAIFGLVCGTYVGVTGDRHVGESDDDASFFDVQNSLVYSWDFPQNNSRNPDWVGTKVGYVGYAFLESPGNAYDGIDNDRDAGVASTKFLETDFLPVVVKPLDYLVTITRRDTLIGSYPKQVYYKRDRVQIGSDSILIGTLGMAPKWVHVGDTLAEGNIVKVKVAGVTALQDAVNPNALDGIDNDFDGLIDENYYVHYRQVKKDKLDPTIILFDILSPTSYINYKAGIANSDKMIDESRIDNVDNDGDWDPANDDVGKDGLANSGDLSDGENSGDASLGEPNFDAKDIDESDQIGLTSFDYFAPSNEIDFIDDEALWTRLTPGGFSTPSNIVNGVAQGGADGDFTFGSGFFPLLSKQTESFSFGLLYGENLVDFYKNRKVVQNIYDNNYRFPQAPDMPFLKAVAGDKQVILYWGRESEESVDPAIKDSNGKLVKDFEGYKVYKSKDMNFEDVRNITDADGLKVGYIPVAQYDIPLNGIKGYYESLSEIYQTSGGYTFYLGNDVIGLAHKYVDNDVINGQRYFYAVTAYDRGVDTSGIFPSENTHSITQELTGEFVTDQNTAVVTPTDFAAGFRVESSFPLTPLAGTTSNSKVAVVVEDPSKLRDNIKYQVTFTDTRTDGADNNNNGKIDTLDFYEKTGPKTVSYSVKNLSGVTEIFTYDGSGGYSMLSRPEYVDSAEVVLKDASGNTISPATYRVDKNNGKIISRKGVPLPLVEDKIYSIEYKPYVVYKSPYIPNNPGYAETKDRKDSDDIIFDGVRLKFDNFWTIERIDSTVRFSGDTTSLVARFNYFYFDADATTKLQYSVFPYDYQIETFSTKVDSSYEGSGVFGESSYKTKFKVTNLTTGKPVKYIYVPYNYDDNDGALSFGDNLVLLEPTTRDFTGIETINGKNYTVIHNTADGKYLFGYQLEIGHLKLLELSLNRPMKLTVKSSKPFAANDAFEFTTKVGKIEAAATVKQDMLNIQVVPNPYVVMSSIEIPPPSNITSGGRERRIEFRNVPNDAKIYLFTSAGDMIRTLYADGGLMNGTIRWDLKTKENLDVAAGMYFYVLESKYGRKEGKIGIIK